jgi:hypothetical protein
MVQGITDPKTSVWQSPDPILDKYLSGKPNRGVFNSFNLNLYAYISQNTVKFIDPTGLEVEYPKNKKEVLQEAYINEVDSCK